MGVQHRYKYNNCYIETINLNEWDFVCTSDLQHRNEKTNRLENQKKNEHTSTDSKVIWFVHSKMKKDGKIRLQVFFWILSIVCMCSDVIQVCIIRLFTFLFFSKAALLECERQTRKSSGVLKWSTF